MNFLEYFFENGNGRLSLTDRNESIWPSFLSLILSVALTRKLKGRILLELGVYHLVIN